MEHSGDDLYIQLLEEPHEFVEDIKIEEYEEVQILGAADTCQLETSAKYECTNSRAQQQNSEQNDDDDNLNNLHHLFAETECMDVTGDNIPADTATYTTYDCPVCRVQYDTKYHMTDHMKAVHALFLCDLCPKYFKAHGSLYLHLQRNHDINDPYRCSLCRNSFSKKSQLVQHLYDVHAMSELQNTTSVKRIGKLLKNFKGSARMKSSEPAQCVICFKFLKNKTTLGNHIDAIHGKLRPYKCEHCSAAFSNASNLISHMNYIHKKIRPFQCPECLKRFVQKTEVRKHFNATHANLRPHKCHICAKPFNHLSSLRRHVECVHENLRLHKCPKCSADYKDRNGLKKHLVSYHIKGISMRRLKDGNTIPKPLVYTQSDSGQ